MKAAVSASHARVWGPVAVRLIIGGLLVWAGVAKLGAPSEFFGTLLAYELPLGEAVLRWVAVTLPWLELLSGAALLGNVWPETLRPLVFGQCLAFVLVLSQALVRGLEVACGCFGGSPDHWSAQPTVALGRALFLLIGAGYLLLAPASGCSERAGPRSGTGA